MPLFKKNHDRKHDTTLDEPTTRTHGAGMAGIGSGPGHGAEGYNNGGTGLGYSNTGTGGQYPGTDNTTTGSNIPGAYDQNSLGTTHGHGGVGTGTGAGTFSGTGNVYNNDPYSSAGVGHSQTQRHHGGLVPSDVPPAGTLNDPSQSRGGTGQRMTGKVESAIGSLVGSSALKNKGLQKEQEANAIKLQSQELSEAERLEKEALARRERAVGHGAHPANKELGAGFTNRYN